MANEQYNREEIVIHNWHEEGEEQYIEDGKENLPGAYSENEGDSPTKEGENEGGAYSEELSEEHVEEGEENEEDPAGEHSENEGDESSPEWGEEQVEENEGDSVREHSENEQDESPEELSEEQVEEDKGNSSGEYYDSSVEEEKNYSASPSMRHKETWAELPISYKNEEVPSAFSITVIESTSLFSGGNHQINELPTERGKENEVKAANPLNDLEERYRRVYMLGKAANTDVYFYKLRRKDSWEGPTINAENSVPFFSLYRATDHAKEQGSVYDPLNATHNWRQNLHWVLGVIHQRRRILLNSKVILKNFLRKDQVSKEVDIKDIKHGFSAFTLEIAAAIKAGYGVQLENEMLILSPEPGKDYSNCRLSTIDPTSHDVEIAYREIIKFIINKIKTFFNFYEYLEWCSLFVKEQRKRVIFPTYWTNNGEVEDNDEPHELFWQLVTAKLPFYDYKDLENASTSTFQQLQFISFLAMNDFIYQDISPASLENFEVSSNAYKVMKLKENGRLAAMENEGTSLKTLFPLTAPPQSQQFLGGGHPEIKKMREKSPSSSDEEPDVSLNPIAVRQSKSFSDTE